MRVLRRRQRRFRLHQIRGCAALYDADRIGGLADGAAVAAWADRSGNGRTASQGTGTRRPTYQTGEANGRPILRFDGVDDVLTLASALSLAAFTIMLVQRTTGDGLLLGSSTANRQIRIGTSGSNVLSAFDGTTTQTSGTLVIPRNQVSIVMYRGSGSAIDFHENGAALSGGGAFGALTQLDQIGGADSLGVLYGNGDLAVAAIYARALTAREVRRVTYQTGRRRYGLVVA